jgi:predicted site-specific integrase-resolvase
MINQPLLTTAQTAQILAVHADTLRLWRKQGRGPDFVRVSTRYRYRPEAIEAFLKAGQERAR